jgi:hypothetical protein
VRWRGASSSPARTPGRRNAKEKSEVCSTLFDQVLIDQKRIVSARLARPEYLQLVATSEASRIQGDDQSVEMAPPERVELPTQALGRPRSIH